MEPWDDDGGREEMASPSRRADTTDSATALTAKRS